MSSDFTPDATSNLGGPSWLVERRRRAAEAWASAELPTTDQEVWRYSRIGELDLDSRRPVSGAGPAADAGQRSRDLAALVNDAAMTILTVDGHVVESSAAADGIVVGLPDSEDESALGAALDDSFDAGPDGLRHLHDAFAVPIEITATGVVGPIVVIREFSAVDAVSFPRLVVRARAASDVKVIEVFVSPDGAATLSLPVTELIAERDATLTYSSLQTLGDASWQLARLASTVAQNATVRAGVVAFGSDYSRLRCDTNLDGRGANGELYAGYLGTGSQMLDFRTFQDHRAPDTTSNLLFTGALADTSSSVYTGLIKIRPEGRGSLAYQTNHNLKLSPDTFAESVPNLEIENNEVQCSHASTVGPVDPEQRFYLESRGVPPERAERLIVRGIFDDIFSSLDLAGLEPSVRDALDRQLDDTEFVVDGGDS